MYAGQARTVDCARCSARYAVDPFIEGRQYRCARCDLLVAGPGPSSLDSLSSAPDTTWLYGRSERGPGGPSSPDGRRIGRYTLVEELGRGGMGVVYRAWDPDLSRQVALKVLLAGNHSGQENVERFLREARAAARLHHAGIVRVHDIGWHEDRVYFTMDLVDGPSVQEVLDDRGAFPLAEAVRIGAAVARALHEAHRKGVVHRDVKPGNILLRAGGAALIADFGLATEVESRAARLTRSGQLLGTPSYIAPEQVSHRREAGGPPTDQYSLGAVLYEMISGSSPYPDEGAMQVLVALMRGPPAPLNTVAKGVPAALCTVIETAMARDAAHRYPTCLALAEDFERFSRGEVIFARPPGVRRRIGEAVHRHRRALWLGGTALVATGVSYQALRLASSITDQRAVAAREAAAADRLDVAEARIAELLDLGRSREASEVFSAFITEPAHQGTESLARGLLHEAGRRGDREPDAAIDALAAAYASASSPRLQEEALIGLADRFGGRWDWERLAAVLQTLSTRRPGTLPDSAQSWSVQTRLALRDLSGAAHALSVSSPGARSAAIATALSTGAPAPHLGERLLVLGAATDGIPTLLATSNDDPIGRVIQLAPGLPTLSAFELPRGSRDLGEVVCVETVPPRLLVRVTDDRLVMGRLEPSAFIEEFEWTEPGLLTDSVVADVDGDGRDEIYVGVGPYTRRLLRLDPSGDSWVLSYPHPATDAASSDVRSLAAADLDHDGSSELIVAAGAWNAYDLRVLNASGSKRLTWRARRKVGVVTDLLPLGHGDLLVAKSNAQRNGRIFPAGDPFGAPSAVYLARLGADGLELEPVLPNPAPGVKDHPSQLRRLITADLDGDGHPELVAHLDDSVHGTYTLIAPGTADGWSNEVLAIGGTSPVIAGQLDDDRADELVVRLKDDGNNDRPVFWVLGVDGGPVPPRGIASPPPQAVPINGADPVVLRSWLRAEDLVSIGLSHQASRELERLAPQLDAPAAGAAQLRAAQLAEATGDPRTAELYEEAARHASATPDALAGAVRAHMNDHRFGEALRMARVQLAASPQAERARYVEIVDTLQSQVARHRELSLDWADTWSPAMQLDDPVAVRWTQGSDGQGALRVEPIADDDRVLSVPFTWGGDHLAAEVELTLERLEWAGGIAVALEGPEGSVATLEVLGWGGGDLLEREVRCTVGERTLGRSRTVVVGPSRDERIRLRIDLSSHTGFALCDIAIDGRTIVRARAPLTRVPDPGAWTLAVRPGGHAEVGAPMAATATLRSLVISGSDVAPRPIGPRDPSDPRREVWRVAELADAGSWDLAAKALVPLLSSSTPEGHREIVHLLRTRTGAFGPVLQAADPDALPAWFSRAWSGAVHAHPGDSRVQRALTTTLPSLGRQGGELRQEDAETVARLLSARGRAWADLDEPAAARRDLLEAISIVEAHRPVDDPDTRAALTALLSTTHQELAAVEAVHGDRDTALEHARAAIVAAPAPEVAFDAMSSRVEFLDLRTDPRFHALRDQATSGAG